MPTDNTPERMHPEVIKHLVGEYIIPNPMRAISEVADKIAKTLQINPVRAHLGNPTAPLYQPAIDAMIKSLQERRDANDNDYASGYDNHAGNLELRKDVAGAVTKIDGLPDTVEVVVKDAEGTHTERQKTLDENNTFACNAGTGGLNAVFAVARPGSVIFAPRPTYPPWKKIAERLGLTIVPYDLNEGNNFLPNAEQIKELMRDHPPTDPTGSGKTGTNIILYHYPFNPVGKALTAKEAVDVADTMRDIVKHEKNTLLVQEDIYIGTTHADDDIVTPSHFMAMDKEGNEDKETLQHLVLIHSMSKAGHPQERTGVMAIPNREIAKHVSGALSFLTLGSSSTDFVGIAKTLCHIADGGLKKRSESSDKNNYRYKLADYYQNRLEILSKGLCDLESKLHAAIPEAEKPRILYELNPALQVSEDEEYKKRTPRGGYYVFPNFEFMRGREIPVAMREAPEVVKYVSERVANNEVGESDKYRITSGKEVALILANAHYLGFRPITITPGTLFEDEKSMHVRMSAVDPHLDSMKDLVNSVTGVAQEVMGVELGARRYSVEPDNRNLVQATADMWNSFLVRLKKEFSPDAPVIATGR